MVRCLVATMIVTTLLVGCSSTYTSVAGRRPHWAEDTSTVKPMTMDDVKSLTREGLSDSVIIDQLQATGSIFHLSNSDLIDLKKAGVGEKVIRAMIRGSQYVFQRDYYYYSPWYDYPYPYGAYPYWYPSWYGGPGFLGGYYHGLHFPRVTGMHRSFGGRRR